jgi:hypothetical protein
LSKLGDKMFSYTYLIFDKGTQNIYWIIYSLFNKCCWENWISTHRKLKLDPSLSPCTSINSKWIKDLNIRSEMLKLLRERTGNTLELRCIGIFLNKTQRPQQLRERTDKWTCMKLKSFYTAKEMVTRLKMQPTEWEKVFASYTSNKGLIPRI